MLGIVGTSQFLLLMVDASSQHACALALATCGERKWNVMAIGVTEFKFIIANCDKQLKAIKATKQAVNPTSEQEVLVENEDEIYLDAAAVLLALLDQVRKAALALVLVALDSALLEDVHEKAFGKLKRHD
jgi:hypothetical protein